MSNIFDTTLGHWRALTTDDLSGLGGSGSGSGSDRELVVTTYSVKTAFTGASVGDTVTCTQVLDVSSASPSTVATVWRNQTSGADLASAPAAANLTFIGTDALANLTSISSVQGNGGDSPASSDSAAASQVAIAKRTNVLLSALANLLQSVPSDITYDSQGAVFSPSSGSHTYGYDANGNMITDTCTIGSVVRVKTFTWTSGNMTAESKWVVQ